MKVAPPEEAEFASVLEEVVGFGEELPEQAGQHEGHGVVLGFA